MPLGFRIKATLSQSSNQQFSTCLKAVKETKCLTAAYQATTEPKLPVMHAVIHLAVYLGVQNGNTFSGAGGICEIYLKQVFLCFYLLSQGGLLLPIKEERKLET